MKPFEKIGAKIVIGLLFAGLSLTTFAQSSTPTNDACTVNKVRLKFRNDCCFQRLLGATIQASNDGKNWQTLYTINENGTGNWQEFGFVNTVSYQKVRFVAGPTGYGELHELEFYNNDTKLKGSPFGTVGKDGFNSYKVAIDGDENSAYWHGPDNAPGAENFVGLSLECQNTPTPVVGSCVIDKVRLKFRSDCCFERLLGATIQASNDGKNWQILYSISENGTGDWQEFSFTNTTAYQQIRLVAGPTGYGELKEIEFYSGNTKLKGKPFGSVGKNEFFSYLAALDSDENTYWHGPNLTPGDSNFAGLLLDCQATSEKECTENLTLSNTYEKGSNLILKAANSIKANNIIQAEAIIRYQAGEKIDLLDGFEASSNADFIAYLGACNASSARRAVGLNIDTEPELLLIYPNPTSDELNINYVVNEKGQIKIELVDVHGAVVNKIMEDKSHAEGKFSVKTKTASIQTGTYFIRLSTANQKVAKKLMIVR